MESAESELCFDSFRRRQGDDEGLKLGTIEVTDGDRRGVFNLAEEAEFQGRTIAVICNGDGDIGDVTSSVVPGERNVGRQMRAALLQCTGAGIEIFQIQFRMGW